MAIQSEQYKDQLKQQAENSQFLKEQRKLLQLQLKSFEPEKHLPMRTSFIPKVTVPQRSIAPLGFSNPSFSGMQTRSMRQNLVQSVPMQNLSQVASSSQVARLPQVAPQVQPLSQVASQASRSRIQNMWNNLRSRTHTLRRVTAANDTVPLLQETSFSNPNFSVRPRVNRALYTRLSNRGAMRPAQLFRRTVRFLKKYKRPITIGAATLATAGLIGGLASIPKMIKTYGAENDMVVDDNSSTIYGPRRAYTESNNGGGGGGGGSGGSYNVPASYVPMAPVRRKRRAKGSKKTIKKKKTVKSKRKSKAKRINKRKRKYPLM